MADEFGGRWFGELVGPLRPRIQRANMVTLINALEERGVVERQAVAADRRSNALVLTAEGRRLLRKAADAHRSAEAAITRRLGAAGRDQLLHLLELLTD